MSCRHDLANTTCLRCYPGRGGFDSNGLPQIDPGPEEDRAPNLEGPEAVPLSEIDSLRARVASLEGELAAAKFVANGSRCAADGWEKEANTLRSQLETANKRADDAEYSRDIWKTTCDCHAARLIALEDEQKAALAERDELRRILQRIVDTDTHGKNVPDEHGSLRPPGQDFCGRCNRNSYWPHADDCPIALAIKLMSPPPPTDAAMKPTGRGEG